MAFMIQKNVPLPAAATGRGAPSKGYKELLERMEVGDSVVVKRGAVASLHQYAKKSGKKIVTRKVDQWSRRVWVVAS